MNSSTSIDTHILTTEHRDKLLNVRECQQWGKWECNNDINGNAVYYYQFKQKYRINSFLMQELKLYMA
jgi:hypothetical protein